MEGAHHCNLVVGGSGHITMRERRRREGGGGCAGLWFGQKCVWEFKTYKQTACRSYVVQPRIEIEVAAGVAISGRK